MGDPRTAYLGLGSNLGERLATLRAAITELEHEGVELIARSSVYETAPLGPPQPRYLNAAISVSTSLAPRALLEVCLRVEAKLGRKRGLEQYTPRTLDIDILLYGEEIIAEPDLIIPHPRLHERAFALAPLLELVNLPEHPVLGRAFGELLKEAGAAGVTRLEEVL